MSRSLKVICMGKACTIMQFDNYYIWEIATFNISSAKWLLCDSGGVVNSLDFCLASLKSLGCFYFRCVLSSQWKVVTVNMRILHCQLQRNFWRPVVIICLAINNNLLLVLEDAPKRIFSTNSRSSGQQKNDAKTLFFHPPSPFHGNFCNCNSIGICTASWF